MPRAKRKRGLRGAHDDDNIDAAHPPKIVSRVVTTDASNGVNDKFQRDPHGFTRNPSELAGVDDEYAQLEGRSFYDLLDPQEESYFRKVAAQLDDAQSLDIDELQVLLDNVFDECKARFSACVRNPFASRALEKWITQAQGDRLRDLLEQVIDADIESLFRDIFASRLLQSLFDRIAECNNPNDRSRLEDGYYDRSSGSSRTNDNNSRSHIESRIHQQADSQLEGMLNNICQTIKPSIMPFANDRNATHPLRSLVKLANTTKSCEDNRIDCSGLAVFVESFLKAFSDLSTAELRAMAFSASANPIVQIAADIQNDRSKMDKRGTGQSSGVVSAVSETNGTIKSSHADSRPCPSIVERYLPATPEDSSYFYSLLKDPTGSFLAERILRDLPHEQLDALLRDFLQGKIVRLLRGTSSRYVVSRILREKSSFATLEILNELSAAKVPFLFDPSYTDFFEALTTAASAAGAQETLEKLLDPYLCDVKIEKVLAESDQMVQQSDGKKLAVFKAGIAVSIDDSKLRDGVAKLQSLSPEQFVTLCASPLTSRLVQKLLWLSRDRTMLVKMLLNKFMKIAADLAVDFRGSFCLDALYMSCEKLPLYRQRFAEALLLDRERLMGSINGRRALKRFNISLFGRSAQKWMSWQKSADPISRKDDRSMKAPEDEGRLKCPEMG